MTSNALTVENLDFRYPDGYQAVHGVSLEVSAGEIYGLLGTNGAGKTTTLEVVEGFRSPSNGTVRVFGEDPLNRPLSRPRMGIMLQEAGFAPDATVAETLALSGSLSGRRDDVDAVLEMVEMTHRAKVKVGQLSGGEKRRLDFGCAAWGTPELLFLDEPTTGLDPGARARLWDSVRRLRDQGTAVVLTTHYLEEAERYADRIGMMAGGRLIREGALGEIVADLASTIRFMAHPNLEPPLAVTKTAGEVSVISTNNLQDDLLLLLEWARTKEVRLEQLQATSGGLEELFANASKGEAL